MHVLFIKIGAKILRLASLAQDDNAGGLPAKLKFDFRIRSW